MTLAVEAVVFDVGETLVDETAAWSGWADHLGVQRLTFMAALGAAIERGASHRSIFELFAPGLDVDAEIERIRTVGLPITFSTDDLYPDAVPCLRELLVRGFRIGVAANQPAAAAEVLATLGVELELIGTSAAWGIEKPDPRFFARIADELRLAADAIAYVGDRLDNDVGPARAAGMQAVFLRRGPWAWIQAGRTNPPDAALVIESLADLPAALRPGRSPSARTGP